MITSSRQGEDPRNDILRWISNNKNMYLTAIALITMVFHNKTIFKIREDSHRLKE